ncbi:hypothetical protein CTI12_AA047380 [Artemisia annua]|uniref:Uncharacterized protein n=1 Tax=Artemisia annua TaxID=35608 RepID=A0A2U1QCL1_ARTAN|nr:hypothetical protein CTI12_AA047380 [Artemisia annua]
MRKLLSAFRRPHIVLHEQINNNNNDNQEQPIYQIPVFDTAFDFATLPLILAVLLLSVLSLSFIFHLRLRSRAACKLREFNHLWTVRVLLVFFISYWAINEIIRLPFFCRRYLFSFMPSLTLSEQDDLCKLHVVFSLGFFEPGFLIALLFIIKESLKEQSTSEICSVLSVFIMSLPTFILQIIAVFFMPFKEKFPSVMIQSSLLSVDGEWNKSMTCTFPLLSSIVFGVFVVVYSVGLLASCWRVVSLVINKNIRLRIKLLGLTVIISLLLQSIFLGVESFSRSSHVWYGGVLLGMFVSLAMSATVAEIVLVIKPILEALVADGDMCDWNPVVRYLQLVEDPNL